MIVVSIRYNLQKKSPTCQLLYNKLYNPKYSIRISTKPFGYDPKKKIKSIPLYAVFCLINDFN